MRLLNRRLAFIGFILLQREKQERLISIYTKRRTKQLPVPKTRHTNERYHTIY